MNSVVVKAKGGMGNRLLCAMTGIAYAQLAGRQVVVDWSDATYSDDGGNVFGRYFDCPAVEGNVLPREAESVLPDIWRRRLDRSVSSMMHEFHPNGHSSPTIHRVYSIDPRCLAYAEQCLVYWSYTERIHAIGPNLRARYNGQWPHDRDGILGKLLREQGQPRPPIRRRIEQFKQEHWRQPMIGVHLRMTDHPGDTRGSLRILARLRRANPDAGIFLATDDPRCRQQVEERFGPVIATPKWYPDNHTPLHQNDACPNRFENGVEALIDMHLLGACDYLIYQSGSTFSYVAALLSDAPRQHRFDVDRFNPKVRVKRLVRRLLD